MGVQSSFLRRLSLIVGIIGLSCAVSCSSSKKKGEGDSGLPDATAADENTTTGDSDSGRAMGLQTVHFPYDSFTLDEEAKQVLKANAQILKDHRTARIQIEGHCDQRGGIQYNIALGEKRANAVRNYLEKLGLSSERLNVISFGKEKPVDSRNTDEAFAKNRRANFVITSS